MVVKTGKEYERRTQFNFRIRIPASSLLSFPACFRLPATTPVLVFSPHSSSLELFCVNPKDWNRRLLKSGLTFTVGPEILLIPCTGKRMTSLSEPFILLIHFSSNLGVGRPFKSSLPGIQLWRGGTLRIATKQLGFDWVMRITFHV